MEEYGLTPDGLVAKDFRILQSPRKGFQPIGKKKWLTAIKALHRQDVFAANFQRKYPYLYNQGVWIFGDWNKALQAGGFQPDRVRLRSSWDSERIIKTILRLRGRRLPIYPAYVMKNHADLFGGALRHYGSWAQALIATGVVDKAVPSKNRYCLLRDLQDALEDRRKVSPTLQFDLTDYFGSLKKAKIDIKTNPKIRNGWSKRKIISELRRRQRANQTLAYASGRREFPALVSAAEAYFGSWGRAVHAAGIDPNLYFFHLKWRAGKERPYQEIIK